MILNSEDYQFHHAVPFVCIEEYSYNPQGRKKEVPSAAQSLVHFNGQGQLLSCHSPATEERVQCFYLEGRLVKRIFETQKGIKREEQRIYNESGLLIEKQFLQGDHLIQRAYYKYNENLELVREENLQNSKTYRYNEQGLCTEEQIQNDNEHIRSLYYHYDDNGNIIELVEESPVGQTCRLHKYQFNSKNLIKHYRLINQDGLVLSNLKYKYNNFIDTDWLERYTWRLSGRAGKISHSHTHSCFRSPCLPKEGRRKAEFQAEYCSDFQTLELREGRYTGQVRIGLMHGIGRLDFFDGSHYFGAFHSGKMEGYGSFYWPDGRLYQGYFAHNKMEGKGSYYLVDGSLYQGTFAEGKMLSDQAFYFLEASSQRSKEKREALQARIQQSGTQLPSDALALNNTLDNAPAKTNDTDRAFIEAATQALQERAENYRVSEQQQAEPQITDKTENQPQNHPESHLENYIAISEEEITAIQHDIFAAETAAQTSEETASETSQEFAEENPQNGYAEEVELLWNDQNLNPDSNQASALDASQASSETSSISSQSNELLSTLLFSSQESEASPQEPQRLHIQERVPKK